MLNIRIECKCLFYSPFLCFFFLIYVLFCVFVFYNFEQRKEWDTMQIQHINYINKYFILLILTNMSCEINYVTKYCKVDGKCDLADD